MTTMDGDDLLGTKENTVLRVAYALERALNARPPQEVVEAVLGRIRSSKHAPRTDDAASAALEADMISRASSFAAQGAESAAKVTAALPPFPKRDAATLEVRKAEERAWSAAPASMINRFFLSLGKSSIFGHSPTMVACMSSHSFVCSGA